MHDLTSKNTVVPKYLKLIIVLALKFIPTPTHYKRNLTLSFEQFAKDLLTKVFFSGRLHITDEAFNKKLHVEYEWQPKPWGILDSIHA